MADNEVFVFKQSYKPRNRAATKMLNVKHVTYIATRPGVICNPDCGFGLWGKLPGMQAIGNIEDLRTGLNAVSAASDAHTIYRAVLSVGEDTAKAYDLYDRSEWEKLLRSRMNVIRTEMRIKPENFCWMASMHFKKKHPHVHIVYWDAGKEPKQEHINEKRFDEIAEHVRKAFTGALVNEEPIHSTLQETDAVIRQTRLQLQAMLKDANLPEALDLDRVKLVQRTELGDELLELAKTLPVAGSLKYAYLPKAYKERLDAYIEHVLTVSDFAKMETEYAKLIGEVSRLYGNTAELEAEYREKAHRKLLEALGNETLRYLKEVAAALKAQEPPENMGALLTITRQDAIRILETDESYRALLTLLPPFRTPLPVLLEDVQIKAALNETAKRLAQDIRIRSKVDSLADTTGTTKEEKTALRKEANTALYRAMRTLVWERAQEDMGYDRQQKIELATISVLRLFRSASQSSGQLRAQRELQAEKYRNLSETAKKDLRQKRQQAGDWSPEM